MTKWDRLDRRIEWTVEPVIDLSGVGRDLRPFRHTQEWRDLLGRLRADERAAKHAERHKDIWAGEEERYWHTFVTPVLLALTREGLADANEHQIRNVLDTVESELATGLTAQETLRPLVNLQVEDGPILLGQGALLRDPTVGDLEILMGHDERRLTRSLDIGAILSTRYVSELESQLSGARTDQERAEALIAAIGLTVNADVAEVCAQMQHRGVLGGHGGRLTPGGLPPTRFASGSIGPDQVDEVLGVASHLSDPARRSRIDFALRRWSDALIRNRADDRLIDHWIGLEGLLGTDTHLENAYQIATQLAELLGGTSQHAATYARVREVYRCRSAVVHAGDLQGLDLEAATMDARDWHRRAMLLVLDRAEPDQK